MKLLLTERSKNKSFYEMTCELTEYLDDCISFKKDNPDFDWIKTYLCVYSDNQYDIRYPGSTRGFIRLDEDDNIYEIGFIESTSKIFDLLDKEKFMNKFIGVHVEREDLYGK